MAGIVQDQDYHNEHVAPALDDRSVVYRGPVGGADRTKALGSARALLHLINFDEPFGLSVVEAMASGTPVIATNRGSMPELIDHGVTGFLVDSVDEAVDAIGRIGEIDRAACRAAVSARFTVDRMADRYLAAIPIAPRVRLSERGSQKAHSPRQSSGRGDMACARSEPDLPLIRCSRDAAESTDVEIERNNQWLRKHLPRSPSPKLSPLPRRPRSSADKTPAIMVASLVRRPFGAVSLCPGHSGHKRSYCPVQTVLLVDEWTNGASR